MERIHADVDLMYCLEKSLCDQTCCRMSRATVLCNYDSQ